MVKKLFLTMYFKFQFSRPKFLLFLKKAFCRKLDNLMIMPPQKKCNCLLDDIGSCSVNDSLFAKTRGGIIR